jgi:hypothetical protein
VNTREDARKQQPAMGSVQWREFSPPYYAAITGMRGAMMRTLEKRK